jgi:hypothetical protein
MAHLFPGEGRTYADLRRDLVELGATDGIDFAYDSTWDGYPFVALTDTLFDKWRDTLDIDESTADKDSEPPAPAPSEDQPPQGGPDETPETAADDESNTTSAGPALSETPDIVPEATPKHTGDDTADADQTPTAAADGNADASQEAPAKSDDAAGSGRASASTSGTKQRAKNSTRRS